MLQYLSGKIGKATEKSLPEIIREKTKKENMLRTIWLGVESASLLTWQSISELL
jgi:Mn2+/Fe2+ NRAMP family transporter